MRKVVILTLVTLFTCVEYSQAQTTEKEMTRQEKKAAQEALDKAGSAEGGVSDDDLKALKKELQDQIDKLASLDIVNQKIAALKEELKGDFVTDEKLKDLAAEIDKVSAEVMSLIGHRLTSLAVIPTNIPRRSIRLWLSIQLKTTLRLRFWTT